MEFLSVASGYNFIWKAEFGKGLQSAALRSGTQLEVHKERSATGPVQVEVFNLSSYFVQMRKAQALSDPEYMAAKQKLITETTDFIGVTLESSGFARTALRCLFHDGANLLVVMGRDEQAMSVARKIINAMIEQPGALAPATFSVQRNGQSPSKVTSLPDGNQLLVWPDVSTEVRVQNHADPGADRHPDIIQPAPPGANIYQTNH